MASSGGGKLKIVLLAAVPLILIGGFLAWKFLAPQPTRTVNEHIGDAAAKPLSSGTFSGGDPAHKASGTVTLYRDSKGFFLRFEKYEATSGPAVHFYLSESTEGEFAKNTVKLIPVPGGVDGEQATLRGNFNVRIPAGIDAEKYRSIIVWCTRFGVTFGAAKLS